MVWCVCRNDLFRLEKGVMAFGWGRWEEVLSHAQLKKGWTNNDVLVNNQLSGKQGSYAKYYGVLEGVLLI